jgi:hypothetical protein
VPATLQPARPQPYTYRFAASGQEFRFELKFKSAEVTDEELIEVLEGILDQFRQIRQTHQDGSTPNTGPQQILVIPRQRAPVGDRGPFSDEESRYFFDFFSSSYRFFSFLAQRSSTGCTGLKSLPRQPLCFSRQAR